MKLKTYKTWTLVALIGMLYWLFGNLYEQIVLAPNWIDDTPAQMQRLNEFFTHTSPTHYFVPITQIATILVWILFFINKHEALKQDLRMASIYAVLDTALTIVIVSTTIAKLFASNYMDYAAELKALTSWWNSLNMVRMLLTALVCHHLFEVFRWLEKREPLEEILRKTMD